MSNQVQIDVQEYYGKVLNTNADLKTSACCTANGMPLYIRQIAGSLHNEIIEKFYGCGLVVPTVLEGAKVLDLGCGSGRDVYILSKLVGPKGFVYGVDMTQEQIDVATKHIDFHTKLFGYSTPNVSFKKGFIEKLDELGFEENSFDIIVSNCVVNLSPDKEAVFKQVQKLLKPGGEFYFSDVYSDRRIPQNLREHKVLWGECLSGALYWNDFLHLARKCGFADPRVVEDAPISVTNSRLGELVGHIAFYSVTFRLFKLDCLEPNCEDYGHAVIYNGSIAEYPNFMDLDRKHRFETGKVTAVCSNTFFMLEKTRFKPHFKFLYSEPLTHYGIFKGCGYDMPFGQAKDKASSSNSGSCC